MFAFFDLDQTLLPYDTQALFCHHILRQHGWRRLFLATYLPALPIALLGVPGELLLKRLFLNYLWRMPLEELRSQARQFVAETVRPLLYPEVVAKLKEHQAAGLTTILTTASPDFYATEISRLLGFDHCFATRVNLDGQSRVPFTPGLLGPNNKREAKIEAMRSLLPEARPIPGSYAYSDSHADLPLLRLAEFPIAVHPSAKLATECQLHDWPIMRPARPYHSKSEKHWHTLRHVLGL